MDCQQCGTWNPDDRTFCWRCNEELPRPPQETKRRPGAGWSRRTWWIVIVAVLILWIVISCLLPIFFGGTPGNGP